MSKQPKPTRISIEFPSEEAAIHWYKRYVPNYIRASSALFKNDALLDKAMKNKWVIKSETFNGFRVHWKDEWIKLG
tara:strand:+ start:460 stop:687 length:228 start_codon:yes stop_codon:yes gene_type:complete